jgi:hypothetical protein
VDAGAALCGGVAIDRIEVSYCEGWDPIARAAAGPLSTGLAAGRHRAGEQYAVLLAVAGRPVGLVEVATGELHMGARFFDREFRRVAEVDCRLLAPGRLFVIQQRTGPVEDAPLSGYPGDRWLHVITASPGGIIEESVTYPDGSSGAGALEGEVDGYWMGAPEFGGWVPFIRPFREALDAAGLDIPGSVAVLDVSSPSGTGLPAAERPWRPARALTPDPSRLAWLFRAGSQLAYDTGLPPQDDGKIRKGVIEVREAGTLRMPSGLVVAKDPSYSTVAEPFTITVPPGSYPVFVSMVRFAGAPDHAGVAAVKLVARDVPAQTWEMALQPGQDPRVLPDGSFYGFAVDAGTGCFLDASASAFFGQSGWRGQLDMSQQVFAAPADPESGANLIGYHTWWGDGAYPVWIGRSADGEVACFVADMLLDDSLTLDAD